MPLIKPSPTVSSHLQAVQVVTTTLFSPAPTTDPGTRSRSSVPVPAIVGGIIGGVVLAILATFIWVFWGRQIKKTKRKQEEEKAKYHRTKYNTIRNAQISGPKSHQSYRPQLKRQLNDKHIKFANDTKATTTLSPAEKVDPERAKHMLFDNPHSLPHSGWTIEQRLRRTGSIIWPVPHIQSPLKKLSQNSIRNNNGGGPTGEGRDTVSHKRSNVSENSNMSAESRQNRNLILAALGSRGNNDSFHSADRQSNSSLWSNLFRMMPGARSSQHSAANSYQQPTGEQNYEVGTAL